jgi:hypothetical protein
MSNVLLTPDMIARESLRVAHETCQFIATTDRQYDDSFAKTGAKIGANLRVRKPNKFSRTTGNRAMNVQTQAEEADTITVATQDHVDMSFSSVELALTIDEFSERYITPAVKQLVSEIEGDYLAFATKKTFNLAGAAGTAITTLDVPGKARAKLNQSLAPKDRRCIQMDSVTMSGLVNGTAAYFAPNAAISEQYREGLVKRTSMADYYENERVWSMTNGGDVAGEIDESAATNFVQGATVVHMDGLGTASEVAVGMVFTWEGLYACHPETKRAYAHLQQFTVISTANATGTDVDVTFSPAIYTTGPKKNVCSVSGGDVTWTYTAQDGADITFSGDASKSYAQSLMYHPEAFQFITADLPLMGGADKCARRVQDGLSLRVWTDGDIRNDELLMRIDILYGMAALRPEWGCRLIGAAAV